MKNVRDLYNLEILLDYLITEKKVDGYPSDYSFFTNQEKIIFIKSIIAGSRRRKLNLLSKKLTSLPIGVENFKHLVKLELEDNQL